MRTIYCLLLLLCPYMGKTQPIQVGDKVPDIIFGQVLNSKAGKITTSGLKGKLVLLDFWATWCGNCIQKFPLLDSLQQARPAELQVLLVNTAGSGDTPAKVDRLFARLNAGRSRPIQLPVILYDSLLTKYFPHNLLPHYVWLAPGGKVLAITGAEAITSQNIDAALQGGLPALAVKEDLQDFDPYKPLFVNGNGGNGAGLHFRSSFAGYIPGLPSSSRSNTLKGSGATYLLYTNMPAIQLLAYAYRSAIHKNRLRIAVPDSANLYPFNKDEAWLQANSFTYELITPTGKDSAFIFMQQDLQRYLGLAAKTDILLTACYILTADSAQLSRFTGCGNPPANTLSDNTNRCIQNRQPASLATHLDARLPLPVINETGFTKPVDICLPDGLDVQNIPALQNALKPYGLTLSPGHRKLVNLIIYQKN